MELTQEQLLVKVQSLENQVGQLKEKAIVLEQRFGNSCSLLNSAQNMLADTSNFLFSKGYTRQDVEQHVLEMKSRSNQV